MRWAAIIFAFATFLPVLGHGASVTAPSIVLTSVENGVEPQDNFECHGTIHGYIRLARSQTATHILESHWISPRGKLIAEHRSDVAFDTPRSTAYVWLAFPEAPSLIGSPDPELDSDRLTFNGRWHLEVIWDKQPLLKKEFSVHCP